MIPRWVTLAAIVLTTVAASAAVGWWLGQPDPVVETHAPEQRQADGSVVLERRPDVSAKPAQQIPKKAKLERVAQVTVQPDTGTAGEPCQPVSLDLSLVREEDGGRRLLASSPDGTIVGGVDVPVESAAPPAEPLRWAAGVSWSPIEETGGVWVERDIPLFSKAARLGLDVVQTRQADNTTTGADVRIRLGLAF